MTPRLARLADIAYRRRTLMVLGWIAVLIVIFPVSNALKGKFHADYATPGSDSKTASTLIAERFGGFSGTTVDVVWRADGGANSPMTKRRIDSFLAQASRLSGVGRPGSTRISSAGTIGATSLELTKQPWDVPKQTGKDLIALANKTSGNGLEVKLGGGPNVALGRAHELRHQAHGYLLSGRRLCRPATSFRLPAMFERALNAFWILLGAAAAAYAWTLGLIGTSGPESGLFPFLAGLIIMGAGVVLFLRPLSESIAPEFPRGDALWRVLGVVAGLAFMAISIPFLGFAVAGFITMVILLRTVEKSSWWFSLALALVAIVVVDWLFGRILGMALPRGPWGW